MKFEYIRDKKEIDSLINELENKNVNLKVSLNGLDDKLSKLYLYSPIEKLYQPKEVGLEGDFGGRLFKVAKIKEMNLYLLCDSLHNVLGLAKEQEEQEENFGKRMAKMRENKKN